MAKTSPSRLKRAIRRPSTSTSVPLPSTSSSVPSVSGSSDLLATLTNWAMTVPFPSYPSPPLILILCVGLLHPKWFGSDIFLGLPARTPDPGRAYGHQHPHFHAAVVKGLAREARLPQKVPHHEHRQLRLGHHLRFVLQKLDAAGGAPRVTSALVHDVHTRVLFDGQDQTLALLDVERPCALHFQPGHPFLLRDVFENQILALNPGDISFGSNFVANKRRAAVPLGNRRPL